MKQKFVLLLLLVASLSFAQVTKPKKAKKIIAKPSVTKTNLDKTKFKKLQGGTIQTDVKVPTGDAGIIKARKKTSINKGANKTVKEKLTKSNKLLY